jgi:hypothetical protein
LDRETISTPRKSGDNRSNQARPCFNSPAQAPTSIKNEAVADSGERGVVGLSTGGSSSITATAGVIRERKSGGDDKAVDRSASNDTASSSDEHCERASAAAANDGDVGASDDEASDAVFDIPGYQPQETKADEASPHWCFTARAPRTRS